MTVFVYVVLILMFKLKLWESLRWYFQVYDLLSILCCPRRKYKIVSWKNKKFKNLEDLLVSFGLYFIIVEVGSYISTMYYLLL
jgi:hypothetical protein